MAHADAPRVPRCRRELNVGHRFRITFYCPDRHLTYDGRTPDQRGVGGGVTARLRLAAALASRGHSVEVVCNCGRPTTHGGAHYRPLDIVKRIETDVLIMHTTGDQLDLGPLLALQVEARKRVLFVDGVEPPKGWADVGMERLYACSNFIAGIATQHWGVRAENVFVTHHGVAAECFRSRWWSRPTRNLYWIAYATHPSKGLAAAVDVLGRLRHDDVRFQLHVFGGHRLWGAPEQALDALGPGVVYHGLLGQRTLADRLMRCGFALYLQRRPEPFGIALAEAQAAGCLTVASPVGAHAEIIDDGATGFLIGGDPAAEATRQRAADLIAAVARSPRFADRMRRRAEAAPLDWDTVAATWEQDWQGRGAAPLLAEPTCPQCDGQWTLMADGYHCMRCSYYSRNGVAQVERHERR